MTNLLVEWLKLEEGFRARPYRCSAGRKTVGYGRNLEAHPIPARNWTSSPCTQAEAEDWLREELARLYFELRKRRPVIETLDVVRSAALMNMAYQLGVGGVMQFRRMWDALAAEKWTLAADHAMDSRWAIQTPNRARRVAHALMSGEWPKEVTRA